MMVHNRLFLIGLVLLFIGIQLRMVKSFELNEKASQFVEQRFPTEPPANATTSYVSYDPYTDLLMQAPVQPIGTKIRTVQPPRWLGWTFLSVGAVLVLTCPCFKT